MRRVVFTVLVAVLISVLPAHANEPRSGSWSFRASTAGVPVGVALGGWSSSTSGESGELVVNMVTAPIPEGSQWVATWSSDARQLSPHPDGGDLPLGEVVAYTYANALLSQSSGTMRLEYRVVRDGDASPWRDVYQAAMESSRGSSGHRIEGAGASLSVWVRPEVTADYQVEFRASGTKAGDDSSDIRIATAVADGHG